MRASGSSKDSLDFELNLAPVIDCFTVLIAFILISASFASINILDAGIAAGGETSQSATPPPVQVTVEMKPDHSLKIKVSGKENQESSLPAIASSAGQDWDFAVLSQKLGDIKSRWSALGGVTLTAENAVEYKDVVRTLEVVRKTIPSVLLGGF